MVRIKVCGLTRAEDALQAVRCGADALGFIAVHESPRFVSPEQVAAINAALPPYVTTVVVAPTLDEAAAYRTDVAQVYADGGDPRGKRVVRVYRVRDRESLAPALAAKADAVHLDTLHDAALGGTGHTFDWGLAAEAVETLSVPVILAGGLTPDNVAEAVRRVRPYAVDVSSGVESAPGIKDPVKVAEFVAAARSACR